jgi:hypothetical protein
MSLKAFHLIFVSASIAVCLFLGVWSFMSYRDTHARADLVYVITSAIAVIALLWYGKYFLRKLKHISYL